LLGFAWLCLALLGFAWLCLALLGFAWLCLALLGSAWPCLALLDFALPKQKSKKTKTKKIKNKQNLGSYYPKIDARSIVAFLVWALSGSVWLLQSVTYRKILPNIGLTTAPIGPLNC
jgi:hypothetical protein